MPKLIPSKKRKRKVYRRAPDSCPAQKIADAAGLTIEEICLRAGTRREGLSRAYFMKLCRRGGANYALARKLARVCQCKPLVFCWGYEQYQHYSQPRSKNVIPFQALRDTESLARPETAKSGAALVEPNR